MPFLLWLGVVATLDWSMGSGLARQHLATGYPTVSGRIQERKVKSFRQQSPRGGTSTTTWYVDLKYAYSFEGREYTGTVYRYMRQGDGKRESADGLAWALPPGKEIPVYFNPKDPQDSLLSPGIEAGEVMEYVLVVIGFTVIFPIAFFGCFPVFDRSHLRGIETKLEHRNWKLSRPERPGQCAWMAEPGRNLDLTNGIDAEDLGLMRALWTLKRLVLFQTKLDDRALELIGRFVSLEEFAAEGMFAVKTWQSIANMQRLKWLQLESNDIGDSALEFVAQLPLLTQLSVASSAVTDVGLRSVATMSKLESLSFSGAAITDVGLRELHSLKHLRNLSLRNPNGKTCISDKALAEIRMAHPQCMVEVK